MAKLITKFKYLKPNARTSAGGYAKYIATREGVDKIDQSIKLAPSSLKQQQLIEKILTDFPDSKEMLEYEDYLKEPTVGNASEFITRALEDNSYEVMQTKTYADYIATRPRAQRFGSHGLFTDDGVQIKLNDVSDKLNHYDGNVWTVIISIRREDAERLGFNKGERWRDMLRTQAETLSDNFNVPLNKLKWYGAFHNESHHPHVHLMVYADDGIKPYLSHKGVMNLRSSFANDIFAQDLLCIYKKQSEHRDALRSGSREVIAEIVSKINSGTYDNPKLEEMLLQLADIELYQSSQDMSSVLAKQERLKEIEDRIDRLMNIDSEAAQNGAFDEQFRCLHNEMYAIMDELEAVDKTKSKLETASTSIGEIATVISGLKNHPVEYNDLAVRQLIECIKVMSADTIHIYFKDGTKIEATL